MKSKNPMLTSMETVTFSYTTAFWSWDDWELQLDWMALHGINLPLAWVGFEHTLVEVFREIGLTDPEIASFLSGPAFQAWNRFGNIQGDWGPNGPVALPQAWIDGQFELQKKIVARMVDLGMTPVLPAFPGFVPHAISRVFPNASVVNAPQWAGFPPRYSNNSFLEPFDDHFAQLQKSFISKQKAAYGNVTHIYTLDQYNELNPYSGNLTYLHDIATSTIQSLKSVDPNAIWLMQGWLFYEASDFWTDERVRAYLSGVDNNDMLVLDLYSESAPQWQRTHSYYGKPWIWCMLHDYGGNMGLYGQIMNITQNPVEALGSSDSLVGFGLTPEGQEGNEILYDLLLSQAWSRQAIDTKEYFSNWVTSRYAAAGSQSIPNSLYQAWDIMRTTVYNNTNFTAAQSVTESILVYEPSTSGLVDRISFDPTTITYDPSVLVQAWQDMYHAASEESALWQNPSYQYDMVDITRQVMANAFVPLYKNLVSTYMVSNKTSSRAGISAAGSKLIDLLNCLDAVLSTNENFRLDRWIESARAWAGHGNDAAYYEYNARNQITLWGPTGEINDYASKQWGELVSTYYVPRWKIFVNYLQSTPKEKYNATALHDAMMNFELKWQTETWKGVSTSPSGNDLQSVLDHVVKKWPGVFGQK